PDGEYRYTNSNYVLLGGVLEKVTGESVETNFQRQLGSPGGLTSSSFVSPAADSATFAHPYSFEGGQNAVDQWVPGQGISSDTIGPVWTDGGLVSTADDIARFGDALFGGRIVAPSILDQMVHVDSDGEGLGPESSDFGGRTWLGHSGTYGGFESELWSDATRGMTLAVTANMDEPKSGDNSTSSVIWDAIAAALDRAQPEGHSCTTERRND
ncbi:MAG: serine hydrolase domain-containing protein, partial [Acidimicrobiales bacterium]